MNKLFIEKTSPYTISTAIILIWYLAGLEFPASDSLISSTLGVAGVFAGFLATSKTIMMSSQELKVFKDLKQSGYLEYVISYLTNSIWFNLIFCIVNIVGFFVTRQTILYAHIWLFFCTASFVSFVLVTNILLKALKYENKHKRKYS